MKKDQEGVPGLVSYPLRSSMEVAVMPGMREAERRIQEQLDRSRAERERLFAEHFTEIVEQSNQVWT